MKKIQFVIVGLWVILACGACNLPRGSATALPQDNPTSAVLTAGPAVTAVASTGPGTPQPYPDNATGVVQAFLIAYPDDTAGMTSYLSSSLRAALPSGGPGQLLQVQGDVNGFSVQSGSEVPNPPQAVVKVAIQAGGVATIRTFNLVKENNRWVINSITP